MNRRVVHWLTIAVDLLLINLGFLLAYVARYVWQLFLEVTAYASYRDYLGQQLVLNVLLALTFQTTGVWRRRSDSWLEEVARAGTATAAGITLMMAVTFFFQPTPFSRLLIFWALVFIVLFIGAARLMRRLLLNALYRRGIGTERALVIGVGEAGRSLIRTLLARPDLGFAVAGYLDDGSGENNIGLGRIPRLGHYNDLGRQLAALAPIHTVFIALPGEMHRQMLGLLQVAQQYGARVQVVPDLLQLSLNRVEFSNMAGVPVLGVRDMSAIGHNRRFDQALKRALDLTIVVLLAVPALILMAIVAIAIRLDSGGPVLYASPRVGRDGRPFAMYKFRSMVVGADEQKEALRELNEADGPLFKIRDDPRLTPVGRVIRRLSLDELPQIYNILRGQMSLVGPRPPLPEEVVAYKPWHRQRLAVVGGLTGLWQVSGRSDLTFDELCLLDIYYIENWSLALDVRILLQTVPHLLSRRGAY